MKCYVSVQVTYLLDKKIYLHWCFLRKGTFLRSKTGVFLNAFFSKKLAGVFFKNAIFLHFRNVFTAIVYSTSFFTERQTIMRC